VSQIIIVVQDAVDVSNVERAFFFIRGGVMRVATAVWAILFVFGLSGSVAFPDETTTGTKARQVTADTVWNADRQTVHAARQRCADLGGRELDECFADAMQSHGASPEAIAFTRSLGSGGFVRRFREAGRVDIAYVVYPFRANENHGILLVNGEPPVIDVDDIALIPKGAMEQDKTYEAIRKSCPKVTMWPGDRSLSLTKYPMVEALPGGGQGFVVPYTLRNACHACEVLGTVFFSFDFDRGGQLVGIRYLRIELPPRKPPKNEIRKESEEISFVVMAEEGKEFTVRLSSNRTTGYQWRPAGSLDERVVRLVRSDYAPFEGARLGGGGEETWTFLAANRGYTEITMEYVRPWEKPHSPVRIATIKVSVRPASPR
jgi:inhibitor of cysteine peptidase